MASFNWRRAIAPLLLSLSFVAVCQKPALPYDQAQEESTDRTTQRENSKGFKLTISLLTSDTTDGRDIPDGRDHVLLGVIPFERIAPSPCLRSQFGKQLTLRILLDRAGKVRDISPFVCADLDKQLREFNFGVATQDGQPVESQITMLLRIDPL